jgi:cellulose synthase/poly-beta-1,6-N-acetylglucosamine synthase-like glycosyltransferase
MPTAVLTALSVLIGLHVVIVVAAAVGWWRAVRRARNVEEPDTWPDVSVLVPARNEAAHIDECLASILENDYPGRLEVIVIDDGSTDATAARARRVAADVCPVDTQTVAVGSSLAHESGAAVGVAGSDGSGTSNGTALHEDDQDTDAAPDVRVSIVTLQRDDASPDRHKAGALHHGVGLSNGDVLLTTDADCTVGPRWIRSMARRCTADTPFVSGPVRLDWQEKWFDRVQAVEMTALVAFGGGSLAAGFPTICNGANVAVRRDLLDEYPDPDTVAADEVLLQRVAYGSDRNVTFEAHPDAVVDTRCVDTIDAYLEQRARWAWMGTRYPHVVPAANAVLHWLVHAATLAVLLGSIVLPAWQPYAIGALLVKMAGDGLLVAPAARHLGQHDLTRTFIPASLLWVPSVVVVGLLGTFGTVHWKGRPIEG